MKECGGLVGVTDLSKRWKVTRQRVLQLTAMNAETFPTPVGKVGNSNVYLLAECEEWRASVWGK